jgi:ribosomal protein L44E
VQLGAAYIPRMPRPPRNPRRAYDKDGNEFQPATIANHKANGCKTVEASCDDCRHEAIVDVSGFPDDFPVPDVAMKLRCSACGSKQIRVMMNMVEFYEQIRKATGWRSVYR